MELSGEQIAILSDTRFLQVKNELSEIIIANLSGIERKLSELIRELPFHYPEGTFLKGGKISKGEQYRGLPYYILDYPRLFTQHDVFAFRTMLWWGNHFSCTLHLQGDLLIQRVEGIIERIGSEKNLFFCINTHPWDYHYEKDNYLPVAELTKQEILSHVSNNGFIKISDFIPVTAWSQFESFTINNFARFLGYL